VGRQQLLLWAPVCKHHFLYCLRWLSWQQADYLPLLSNWRAQRTAIADGVPHDAFEVFKAALVVSKSAPHVLPMYTQSAARSQEGRGILSARTGRVARNRDLFRTSGTRRCQRLSPSKSWISPSTDCEARANALEVGAHHAHQALPQADENKDPFDDY